MKKSLLITFATAVLLSASTARSQGVNSDSGGMTISGTDFSREKPKSPLFKSAPDFANWTVVFSYPEDAAKKPGGDKIPLSRQMAARPRKMVVDKTGTTMRVETVDVAGRIKDKWYLGDSQYTLFPGQKLWMESKNSPESNDPNFEKQPATGFSDFEWVSDTTYLGRMSIGGRSCLVFVPGGASVLDAAGPNVDAKNIQAMLAAQPIMALVDAESRLPYVFRNRGEVHTFVFGPPPAAKLSIPVDLAEMIRRGMEAQARLLAPIPRP
ncbi:MAG: hypothetical protein WCO94_00650 [Verrucomicrobiota bacterium]